MGYGKLMNSIIKRRLLKNNQNILVAITGKTGSGKSYSTLSICELYYNEVLNKEFPIENCCFSLEELMKRLRSGQLKKGDLLILEEAGVNAGSLDFQNKIVKMFNYLLQSFRSLNVGLIVNLPMFSMLNKQSRMLMHLHLQTVTIDKDKKIAILKPLWLQYNQHSGKLYLHRPEVYNDGVPEKIDYIVCPLPSSELRKKYEQKKENFLFGLVDEFNKEIEKVKDKDRIRMRDEHKEIFHLYHKGITKKSDLAKELNKSLSSVCNNFKTMDKNYKNWRISPEMPIY